MRYLGADPKMVGKRIKFISRNHKHISFGRTGTIKEINNDDSSSFNGYYDVEFEGERLGCARGKNLWYITARECILCSFREEIE